MAAQHHKYRRMRFDATCRPGNFGEVFESRMKELQIQKYLDACGQLLRK